jgi:hypothetical protein
MAGDHSFASLSNPFTFAAMAVIGCTVGHALMVPLGGFELSSNVGTWLADNVFSLPDMFGVAAEGAAHSGEILSSINPDSFAQCVSAGGAVHPHGADVMACVN